MVIPGMVPVVDDGSAKAPRWVDAGASDGDGGQVDQEHREPNRQRGQDLNMGVSGIPLGISSRENGVDQDEGANDLSAKAIALGVATGDYIGAATVAHVQTLLEALHHSSSTDGP
uniref:Uncharacterized protein n=1 Tax=Triticum urartu TaxID=4572 RepID=A0A8R7UYD4_TRIUA